MLLLCLKSFCDSHCFQDKIQTLRSFKALGDLASTFSFTQPFASHGPTISSDRPTIFWMMHVLGVVVENVLQLWSPTECGHIPAPAQSSTTWKELLNLSFPQCLHLLNGADSITY